jgi:hypothetical protein
MDIASPPHVQEGAKVKQFRAGKLLPRMTFVAVIAQVIKGFEIVTKNFQPQGSFRR